MTHQQNKQLANTISLALPWALLFATTFIAPLIREARVNYQLEHGLPGIQRKQIYDSITALQEDVGEINARMRVYIEDEIAREKANQN